MLTMLPRPRRSPASAARPVRSTDEIAVVPVDDLTALLRGGLQERRLHDTADDVDQNVEVIELCVDASKKSARDFESSASANLAKTRGPYWLISRSVEARALSLLSQKATWTPDRARSRDNFAPYPLGTTDDNDGDFAGQVRTLFKNTHVFPSTTPS